MSENTKGQEEASAHSRAQAVIGALDGALELEAMMYRHLADSFEEEFAGEGIDAVDKALHEYGLWRGHKMRQHHLASGLELSARNILEHWTTGDIVLLLTTERGDVRGDDSKGEVRIYEGPEWRYLVRAGSKNLARPFYALTYEGIAEGYDPELRVDVPRDFTVGSDVPISWWINGRRAESKDVTSLPRISSTILEDPKGCKALIRRTIQNRSALYVTLAREAIRRFDVAGEHAVREGIRRMGTERGTAQRERHMRQDKQATLRSLMSDFDVPVDDAWEWRDGYLSDGVWFQDCTFCPHIPVWKELNALDLGYIYDVEIHQSQFRAYHPDVRVQWETLQTRGSSECRFRFIIPSLRRPDEPSFTGPADRL